LQGLPEKKHRVGGLAVPNTQHLSLAEH
jgi:hypothetical protein